jgi:hypothetical protein
MDLTDLFLAATHDPKTRLISQGEHAHTRFSPKSSPVDVGFYTPFTRSGDIMNPNKKRERIYINLKISVMGVVCMVIGFSLVACQNILQIYIKPL